MVCHSACIAHSHRSSANPSSADRRFKTPSGQMEHFYRLAVLETISRSCRNAFRCSTCHPRSHRRGPYPDPSFGATADAGGAAILCFHYREDTEKVKNVLKKRFVKYDPTDLDSPFASRSRTLDGTLYQRRLIKMDTSQTAPGKLNDRGLDLKKASRLRSMQNFLLDIPFDRTH